MGRGSGEWVRRGCQMLCRFLAGIVAEFVAGSMADFADFIAGILAGVADFVAGRDAAGNSGPTYQPCGIAVFAAILC